MRGPAGDAGSYLYDLSFGDPGDGIWWYSVATAAGVPPSIFLSQPTACGDRSPDAGETCVSVAFDYPTSAVVQGSLPL